MEEVALSIAPLARDTLQERIYEQVSDLILDGGIAPGQLVTIQSLADAFGVSAMPVREALKRLTAAGALTVVSGRSMGIPKLNYERLLDLRNVRLEIESVATEWAVRSITDPELAGLEHELHRMERAVQTGDVKDYLRGNRAFHFAIYEASRSPTLIAVIRSLWLQISPYFNLLHASGSYAAANESHAAILDGMRCRDATRACAAVQADMETAFGVLAGMLQEHEPDREQLRIRRR